MLVLFLQQRLSQPRTLHCFIFSPNVFFFFFFLIKQKLLFMPSSKLEHFFTINFLFSNSFSEKNRFFLNVFLYIVFFYSSLCALRKTTTVVQFKEAAECQQERK